MNDGGKPREEQHSQGKLGDGGENLAVNPLPLED